MIGLFSIRKVLWRYCITRTPIISFLERLCMVWCIQASLLIPGLSLRAMRFDGITQLSMIYFINLAFLSTKIPTQTRQRFNEKLHHLAHVLDLSWTSSPSTYPTRFLL